MTTEFKTYKQAGAIFLIPCNAVGEEMPEPIDEYENREREMAEFVNWFEQQTQLQLMKNDFYE